MNENEERDTIILESDDGREVSLEVKGYFFYNGEEYAILQGEDTDENAVSDVSSEDIFVMQIKPFTDENGEEMEEFVPVDAEIADVVGEAAKTRIMEILGSKE